MRHSIRSTSQSTAEDMEADEGLDEQVVKLFSEAQGKEVESEVEPNMVCMCVQFSIPVHAPVTVWCCNYPPIVM